MWGGSSRWRSTSYVSPLSASRRSGSDARLVVGLYIEQICLAVLFFLKLADGVIFVVEGALMILLIALTLSAQLLLRRSFLRTSTSICALNLTDVAFV